MDDSGKEVELATKPSIEFVEDQVIGIETPGAGGYGNPHSRPAEKIDEDELSEKFSAAYLQKHYHPKMEN